MTTFLNVWNASSTFKKPNNIREGANITSKRPELTGLTFSASSQQAIQAIRVKQKLANELGILAVTPLIEIFGSKGGMY